jgi:hypothetical protein
MCLIAVREQGTELFPVDKLKNAQQRNSDGWGIMYADGKEVRTIKKVAGWDAFEREFERVDRLSLPTALHFRFATQGAKINANCHPFKVLDRNKHGLSLWLMHNGTLRYDNKGKDDSRSDTAIFVDSVLRPVLIKSPGLIREPAFQHMLAETIGFGNKLVFLEGTGDIHIINRKAGDDQGGIWFSNTYSLNPPQKWTGGKWSGNYYGGWEDYKDEWRVNNGYTPADSSKSAADSASVLMPTTTYERDGQGTLWKCTWQNGVQTKIQVAETKTADVVASGTRTAEDQAMIKAYLKTEDTQSTEFQALVKLAVDVRTATEDAKKALNAADIVLDARGAPDEIAAARAEVEKTQAALRDARAKFWEAQKALMDKSQDWKERNKALDVGMQVANQEWQETEEESEYDSELGQIIETLPAMSEQEIFELVTSNPEVATDIIRELM